MTLDGFVARPDGRLDWMWLDAEADHAVYDKVIELAEQCEAILLGRKMTDEFIDHWENVYANMPESHEYVLARRMVEMRKIVFSRSQAVVNGKNVEVENGDFVAAVQKLKEQADKDLIVYGGAAFVSSLINANLIDEYYIFSNPVAIGSGLPIFTDTTRLKLIDSLAYKNGKMLNTFLPA